MKKAIIPILIILALTSFGCYLVATEYLKAEVKEDLKEELEAEPGVSENAMITEDTMVLIAKNTTSKELTLRLITGGKEQTFSYNGTTAILGRHGDSLSMEQLEIGEVLDVVYSNHNHSLDTLQISSNTWTNTGITKFSVDEKKKIIQIGEDQYQYTDDIVISSDGEAAQLMDITEQDTLTIKGYNRKICSIIVEKGHGYIRLLNDAYFVGGWIEVGQAVIKPVTSEMLLPVPEGTYTVRLTNKGYAGQKEIQIQRDKETEIDLSEIDIEEVAIGHIAFQIVPDYAQLYIDGEMTDFTDRVALEYGIHSIRVELAGYETVETNVKIGSEYANLEIQLDEEQENSSSSSSSSTKSSSSSPSSSVLNTTINGTVYSINSSSVTPQSTSSTFTGSSSTTSASSSSTEVVSDNKKLYVESPAGAEIYLDGNYIGIAPISTNKVTGSHVITISKSGYQTKSYTVSVDNDGNDVTFSFSDLVTQ